ncbi:MAG: hypothetical protein IJW91_01480 [Phascolarctobacterium sp.]|nr:hypothetical protein [Phascolarctobacterium sp.]MBQ7883357.1 hypothetical protein [Phascolarctobacterium sp.]
MMKKFLAAGLLTLAFTAAPLFDAEIMPAAIAAPSNVTMENYPALVGKTHMSQLSNKDLREIKRTAPELKEISDWNRRVAYYLGSKDYAVSTMWAPQRIQLITPYSLTKYLYFLADKELVAPDQALLDEVAELKDVVWVWVWNSGSYNVLNNNPAPTIENVVIRSKDNDYFYHLDTEKYMPVNAMKAAKVDTAQLWPFPAKVFSQSQIPFEIVLMDSADNKKPLKIKEDDLAKCK